MATTITAVDVRKERGVITVIAMGQTARGQRVILKTIPLKVTSMTSPDFKGQMDAALKQLYAESVPAG